MPKRQKAAHEPPGAAHQPPAPEEQARPAAPQNDMLHLQHQAGNRAVSELIEASGPGQPLPAATQGSMEARLGQDLSDVRVHTGEGAAQAAQSVDAAAFTAGSQIVFGAGSYAPGTPAGDRLLAHELAHVVQQRQASAITDGVSAPGDPAEQAADAVAQGQTGQLAAADSVPAVQRQPVLGKEGAFVTRVEAQEALIRYLEQVMQEQGGQTLRVTPQVKLAVQRLFQGDLGAGLGIQVWLNSPSLPGSPAEFARQVAARLPERMPQTRIAHLGAASVKEPADTRPKTFGEAAGNTVVDSTVVPLVRKLPISKSLQDTIIAGARSAVADGLVGLVEQAMANAPIDSQAKSAIRSAVEAAIKQQPGKPMDRQQEGAGSPYRQEPPPSAAPPMLTVPGEQIFKLPPFKFDLPGTPAPAKRPAPLPAAHPAVEAAISAVAPDALIPSDARGTTSAGQYADGRDLAREIVRLLEAAQQRKEGSVSIELGASYSQVKDRAAIYATLREIVYRLRDALPHHASAVSQITITIKGQPVHSFPLRPRNQ